MSPTIAQYHSLPLNITKYLYVNRVILHEQRTNDSAHAKCEGVPKTTISAVVFLYIGHFWGPEPKFQKIISRVSEFRAPNNS